MRQQDKNIVAACQEVLRWCDRKRKSHGMLRHRLMRIVVMTILDETGGSMYANANIPTSLTLPYDAIGTDHNSVGLFQQQVGTDGSNQFGWGSVSQCMNIEHSTDAFLNRLDDKGLAQWKGSVLWERCQAVQVSAFPDGSNYRRYYHAADEFIIEHAAAIHGPALDK